MEIYFERSRENVLATVREKRPSLVIFDLNSSRLAPMEVIAAMKADPELKRVMTLGYVSHVDSEAIAAARRAGIDQVLARSTFAERLGAILSSSDPAVVGGSEDPALRARPRSQNHHARTATTISMAPAMASTRPMLVDEVCASSSSSPATPSASSTAIDDRSSPANATALWYRLAGLGASAFRTTASISFGTLGFDALGADAPRCMGRRVVSIS